MKNKRTKGEGSLYLVLFFIILHLFDSFLLDLGDAEALYWNYGMNLQGCYLDHPPLLGILIRGVTEFTSSHHPFWVRLPANCGFILSIYFLYKFLFLINTKDGIIDTTIILFLLLPLVGGGGIASCPESISIPLWVIGLYFIYKYYNKIKGGEKLTILQSIFLGFILGLNFLAKYTGFLLIVSLTFLSFYDKEIRKIWKRVYPYITIVTIVIVSLPVILWNIEHDFVSLKHRLFWTQTESAFSIQNLVKFIGGQFLYFGPTSTILLWVIFFKLFKDKNYDFFLIQSVFPLIFLTVLCLWSSVSEPHWTFPGYIPLIVLSGIFIREKVFFYKLYKLSIYWNSIAIVILHLVCLTPFIPYIVPDNYYEPKYDITNELYGWNEFIKVLRNRLKDKIPVAGPHYTVCSQISYHLKRNSLENEVYCITEEVDDFDIWGKGEKRVPNQFIYITDNRFPYNHKLLERILERKLVLLSQGKYQFKRGGKTTRIFSYYILQSF